jgi:hypothetical protein
MSKREIAALALRLLGIYCLVQSLPYIQGLVWFFTAETPPSRGLGLLLQPLLPAALLMAAGVFLLLRADRVGQFVAGREPEQPVTRAWSTHQVQSIAFSAVGAYLLAVSLPDLCMFVVQAIAACIAVSGMPKAQVQAVMQQQGAHVIASLLRTALGLWLFLGAKGWSNLWHRLHPTMGPAFEATPDRHNTE